MVKYVRTIATLQNGQQMELKTTFDKIEQKAFPAVLLRDSYAVENFGTACCLFDTWACGERYMRTNFEEMCTIRKFVLYKSGTERKEVLLEAGVPEKGATWVEAIIGDTFSIRVAINDLRDMVRHGGYAWDVIVDWERPIHRNMELERYAQIGDKIVFYKIGLECDIV